MPENALYLMDPITDDPEFEGFGFGEAAMSLRNPGEPLGFDFGPDDIQTKGRAWTVTRMASMWTPQPVLGRVQPHNDYPCVNLTIPAFSRRAVDALRDFLEPNGELLPLVSPVGEYYAYNITTVVDILDHERSEIEWYNEKHDIALHISRYECLPGKLTGLSIFRLVEKPAYPFVHQVFVDRVRQHGLREFHFKRLWPLRGGVGGGDSTKDG
jgi:hypothetical protein